MILLPTLEEYKRLYVADFISDGKIAPILNAHGVQYLTVCPECAIDDFQHLDSCSIAHEIDSV